MRIFKIYNGGFKLGGFAEIHQTAKLNSKPNFTTIRYVEFMNLMSDSFDI